MNEFEMSELDKLYEEARKSYVHKLSENHDQIKEIKKNLQENVKDKIILDELYHLIHTITGSAGMLGFTSLHESCHELESYLLNIIESTEIQSINPQKITFLIEKLEDINVEINKLKEETN